MTTPRVVMKRSPKVNDHEQQEGGREENQDQATLTRTTQTVRWRLAVRRPLHSG